MRRFLRSMVGLTLLLFAACGRTAPAETADEASAATPERVTLTADQIRHGAVKWGAATTDLLADSVPLPGRVRLDDDRTVRLSAPARGRVIAVRANVGDRVQAGEPLVILQSEDAAGRRADLARATAELTERQAALRYAVSARERAERLLALKAGSAQDVERAKTDEAGAVAALAQTQAAIEQTRAALQVLQVDDATGQIRLASPVAGLLVSRAAAVGDVLEAGALTLVVSDTAHLWLEFGAPDDVANRVRPGQTLTFTVSGLEDRFDAQLLRASGVVDPQTRLVTVRGAVGNQSGRLRPEMFVTVDVNTSQPTATVVVPEDAVQLLDEHPVVFVAEPDGRGGAGFTRRAVRTGRTTSGRTPIPEGLSAGDLVVVDGAFAVRTQFARGRMPAGE